MKHYLFPDTELKAGEMRAVVVDDISIVVLRDHNGALHALRNACAHQGALLSKGHIEPFVDATTVGDYRLDESRTMLVCAQHGYEYDVDDGRCPADSLRVRVRAYPVATENGRVVLER